MKGQTGFFFSFLSASLVLSGLLCGSASAQKDVKGCKDHPLFTRMPNYSITECKTKDFDQHEFYVAGEKEFVVEGKKTFISYEIKEGVKPPSEVQIKRNFENAVAKIGGRTEFNSTFNVYLSIKKDGKETWVDVHPLNHGEIYTLTVVEKKGMEQDITANTMLDALNKDGFIALYINFDTNRATIKPESKPIIDQIVKLLKDNPGLKVGIEGHTDSTGTPAKNKALSQERAQSVVNALTALGIDKKRLSAAGWGQEKPIADNRSEEGKAKNRRVEIVKK